MARRNKLAFAAAGAVAAALVLGLAASAWEYLKERNARQRAETSERQARAINEFLTQDVLGQATPEQNAREKKVTVTEALNVATRRLDQRAELGQPPELEASLRLAVGRTYSELGLLSEAERNLRRAVTLRRSALGRQHLDTFAAQHWLAKLLLGQRKNEESESLSREAWQGRLRLLGAEHRDTLSSQELYEQALSEQGKLQEAEPIARQILEIRERLLGPDDPATISSLGDLGQVLELRGDYADAERYLQATLTRLQRNGLADTQDGFLCLKEIAYLRLVQGDSAEAAKLLTEAVPRAARVFGPDNFLTLHIQRILVRVLAEEGRLDKAEALGKETLEARRRTKANQDDIGTGRTLLYLGRVLVEKGKLDEAEPLLQEALTIFRRDASSKSTPELAAQAANWLGAIQVARKAYPEAETLLLSGTDQFFAPAAEIYPNERRLAVGHIVNLYQAWGKPEQATLWQRKLDQLAKNPAKP
jgi:tetratricopeptide (TPR) repeat protein